MINVQENPPAGNHKKVVLPGVPQSWPQCHFLPARDLGPETGVPPRRDLGSETGVPSGEQTDKLQILSSLGTLYTGGKIGFLTQKKSKKETILIVQCYWFVQCQLYHLFDVLDVRFKRQKMTL